METNINQLPANLIFIQSVPKDSYFVWQIAVQIVNFRKFGISEKMEIIIWYPKNYTDFSQWKELENKYPEVSFFYYEDQGVNLGLYIPQIRPHSLKQHFKVHEERLKDKVFFYHDADIIFNFLPDFNKLCQDDTCWQSNCSSYLDYTYMRSKEVQGEMEEDEGVKIMADIGNITVEIIKSYDKKSGGAQNILKNIDWTYWEDVEKMCLDIRNQFLYGIPESVNSKYFKSENDGWQSWCCDMWAVNFSLWKRGLVTDITPELDFSWATDNKETFFRKPVFHNAGCTPDNHDLFYKGAFINKSPFGEDFTHINPETASYQYVLAIQEVK